MPCDVAKLRLELVADLEVIASIDTSPPGGKEQHEQIESLEDEILGLEQEIDELRRELGELNDAKPSQREERLRLDAPTRRGRIEQAIEILRSHGRYGQALELEEALAEWPPETPRVVLGGTGGLPL